MPILATERMNLIPLTAALIEARLERDRFARTCGLEAGDALVDFPPSWPGDALVMFGPQLAALSGSEDGEQVVAGSFAAVVLADLVAVGQLGTKGPPTPAGEQEIGYGFAPEVWGRGLATEAVAALTMHLLERTDVTAVTAETAMANLASARVLEKNGFARVGTGWDEDDGDLVLWRRERAAGS